MRVLMAGFADYPLFFALAERLAASPEVTGLGVWSPDRIHAADRFREIGASVFQGQKGSFPIVRGVVAAVDGARALRHSGRWDVVSVHYLHPKLGLLAPSLRAVAPRMVATFWGSDLYRAGRLARVAQARLLRRADAITVLHREMRDEVELRFGPSIASKVREVRFGLSPLDWLVTLPADRAPDRRRFGLPERGPVVAVGYNAAPGQRHLDALASIERAGLPADAVVLLPLLYGADAEYVARVRAAAAQSALDVRLIEGRLDLADVAALRRAVDVLVQVQPTDALSGSMQEHLYAGTVVVTGAWLRYGVLDEIGVPLERVARVDEVGVRVRTVIDDLPVKRRLVLASRDAMWRLSSWESNLSCWIDTLRGSVSA